MAARLTAYVVVAIVGATLIAGLIVGAQRDDSDGPVDLIVRNAVVYTADRRGTMAEAVAIRGNQILQIGSDREIARLQRPQTVVVDAHGGAVLPGFNDSHVDLVRGARALRALRLDDAADSADLLRRVADWGSANPSAPWIVGSGWSPRLFKNGLPGRQALDEVARERPVLLYGPDERTAWVNSAALKLAGITRGTPEPPGGTIVREARGGQPSGVLRGGAVALVSRLLPPESAEARLEAVRTAVDEANALGITSVHSMGDTPGSLATYESLRREGELSLRIYSGLRLDEPLTETAVKDLEPLRTRYADDPLLKAGALFVPLDGDLASGAAAMLDEPAGEQGAEPAFDPDDLNRTARLADAAGWQMVTLAHGDRAVRMALTAYAHATRSNLAPARGRRHRIAGLGLVDDADVPRFAPLGVAGSVHPAGMVLLAGDAPLARQLGASRAARAFPLGRLAAVTRVTFGSGWPDGALDPMYGIEASVAPRLPAEPGAAEAPDDERFDLKAAIGAYTAAGAWASYDEGRKGTLSRGMLADLVVLTHDIFSLPPGRLSEVDVASTIFDGKLVYQRAPRRETGPAPVSQ